MTRSVSLDRESVYARKSDIEHDEVRLCRSGLCDRAGPVRCGDHVEARLDQVVPDEAGDFQFVIYYEDPRHLNGILPYVAAALGNGPLGLTRRITAS